MNGFFPGARRGITLIELILAVTLLAIVASVSYFSFDAGVKAWRAGTELADSLHHADYVLEQLAMGLRSAYYPDADRPVGAYGLLLTDNGEGAGARDTISWVKLGTALIGADAPIAGTPHRIEVFVDEPGEAAGGGAAAGGLAVRAWRIAALPEEFDPAKDVATLHLTPRVVGMNCRVLDPANNLAEGDAPAVDDELEWLDEWEGDYTNRLPHALEVSLYLAPSRDDEEALEVKRIVEIPLAPLAWRDKGAAGGRTPSDSRPVPGRGVRTRPGRVDGNVPRDIRRP